MPASIATLVSQGISTPQPAARLPIYQQLQQQLWDECLEIPLVAFYKYQVVNKRLHNMYVALTDFNTGLKAAWVS